MLEMKPYSDINQHESPIVALACKHLLITETWDDIVEYCYCWVDLTTNTMEIGRLHATRNNGSTVGDPTACSGKLPSTAIV